MFQNLHQSAHGADQSGFQPYSVRINPGKGKEM
jgi:hypothetical protein